MGNKGAKEVAKLPQLEDDLIRRRIIQYILFAGIILGRGGAHQTFESTYLTHTLPTRRLGSAHLPTAEP